MLTIQDPDPDNMHAALAEISRLEGYRYDELRHRTIDLGQPILRVTRIVLLLWLLAAATIFHPAINRRTFGTQTQ